MSKTGVMICGHGSRSQAAVDQFSVLAEKLPAYFPDDWLVEYGYLEFANPVIRDGLDKLRAAGCDRILAVPGMLFAAMHSKNDIPTVLNTYAAKHGVEISYGRELGVDPKMIAAAGARIQEAVDQANAKEHVAIEDTCLVIIGRGASDPDANGNVAKIARMLHEGMGFGWVETGYSGVTFPLVEPCLQHAAKLDLACGRALATPQTFRELVDCMFPCVEGVCGESYHLGARMRSVCREGHLFLR